MKITHVSSEVREVMEVAHKNHWGFRVVGDEGILERPEYINGWWFVPGSEETTPLPEKALKRLSALQEAGVVITGVIVAHEAPMLLPAPKADQEIEKRKFKITMPEVDWSFIPKGLEIVAKVLEVILLLIVTVVSGVLYGLGMVLAGLTFFLIDPALIIVLSDGTRIQVLSWHEL